jgi:hypothetical protein
LAYTLANAASAGAGSGAAGPDARYSVAARDSGSTPVSITSAPGISDPEAA